MTTFIVVLGINKKRFVMQYLVSTFTTICDMFQIMQSIWRAVQWAGDEMNLHRWLSMWDKICTQKRKDRQVDSLGIHWRRWSLSSTSSVNIRVVALTTFPFHWWWWFDTWNGRPLKTNGLCDKCIHWNEKVVTMTEFLPVTVPEAIILFWCSWWQDFVSTRLYFHFGVHFHRSYRWLLLFKCSQCTLSDPFQYKDATLLVWSFRLWR